MGGVYFLSDGFSESFKNKFQKEFVNIFNSYFNKGNAFIEYNFTVTIEDDKIRIKDNYFFLPVYLIFPDNVSREMTICWTCNDKTKLKDVHKKENSQELVDFFFTADFPKKEIEKVWSNYKILNYNNFNVSVDMNRKSDYSLIVNLTKEPESQFMRELNSKLNNYLEKNHSYGFMRAYYNYENRIIDFGFGYKAKKIVTEEILKDFDNDNRINSIIDKIEIR